MARRDIAKTSGTVAVLVTDTAVVAANLNRVEVTIVNDGANTVYLQLQTAVATTNAAVAGQGIRLNPNGGAWTNTNYVGAVRGIASGGTSNITVCEI